MRIDIRNEREGDHRAVEELTREAFWNLYVPGCDEHYLVHVMREHPDFIPELAFVAEVDGTVAGNIMYTKSHVEDEEGGRVDTLTFGPLCVAPDLQRRGIGTRLIRHTKELAMLRGCPAILILGHPHNYCSSGFRSARDYGISDAGGRYPYGLLALVLDDSVFGRGRRYRFRYSDVYELDPAAAEAFDGGFPPRAKEYRYTQDLYSMSCRAYLE